ncbi:MAG: alpha/beta fold hydrolase [Bdellovibrionaceae bacterium]|nr:alpha/beta fold hydrolase [Pseudobdellovibrionaceae bacterium]MBX3034522.1 alpha/beta fold hydrolase [Pseudobdellovibrionaceae bacterium]
MRGKRLLTFALGAFALCLAALLRGSVFFVADYHPVTVDPGPDFESVMAREEAALPLRAETGKTVVWRYPDHRRTPLSLVQIHGFSASRREISPLGERLAAAMNANLFMTRLSGHGLGSEGMGGVKAENLLQDAEEAFGVGRRLGDKVVLLGTSTGAALALSLAKRHPEGIAAMVFLSPIHRPADPFSLLLKGPVGGWLARHVIPDHHWVARSAREEQFWTTTYPMTAVHELMNLVSWTNRIPTSGMRIPLLVFYSEQDKVVSVELIKENFQKYGGPKKLVNLPGADHVLAGEIKGPQFTESVLRDIEAFLKQQAVF